MTAAAASPLRYELLAADGGARRGRVTTARGMFDTPIFMPVGTRGAVVHLDACDYDDLGLGVVLANTYHLMARPGCDAVAALGGLHAMTGWDGHFLTDSGGFQVMSLGRRTSGRRTAGNSVGHGSATPRVDDEGVVFRSVYDGSRMALTPEAAVEAQRLLGSDIQMALDVCPALPGTPAAIRQALERTHAWAQRAADAMTRARTPSRSVSPLHGSVPVPAALPHGSVPASAALPHDPAAPPRRHLRADASQAQFGIVQGGIDVSLRRRSAECIAGIGFDGYGIGGLSVGESRADMGPALWAAAEVLPAERPRYLMGVGDPARIADAVAAGVDMFDCVLPTRLARHGTALTAHGRVNIRNARFAADDAPLGGGVVPPDAGLDDLVAAAADVLGPVPAASTRFSRAYLRHLMSVNEPTAARLLTLHNVAFLRDLLALMRFSIEHQRFAQVRAVIDAVWS